MDILFWSGGKDAYMALQFYRQEHPDTTLHLLTTYDESDNVVPHQLIELSDIKKQAANLGIELVTVPLPPDCPNEVYLEKVEVALKETKAERLIFGDWKNSEIRQWREDVFGPKGYTCLFPIWEKSIHDLLPVLIFKPVTVQISAVKEEFQSILRVGEIYDQSLVTQLQHLSEDIDPMGENGEFHTKVIFNDQESNSPLSR